MYRYKKGSIHYPPLHSHVWNFLWDIAIKVRRPNVHEAGGGGANEHFTLEQLALKTSSKRAWFQETRLSGI